MVETAREHIVQKLARLSWPERFIAADAWLRMLWIAGILRTPYRNRLFVTNRSTGESRLSQVQVERLAWLVNAMANRHVKRMTCLERALTLQSLLAKQGCHASLRFGVRKGDATVEAHAWLEGVPGLSDPLSSDFIPLKNFSERHCQN
ncbi:hypothetical protein BQ8794_50273 [Mesorhizobium prunaredense]|uniref:Microcin J25-processing protein McjB C-terminal domain-containing protein n=1 Tax=Mesorhizobium prunaredense TaxID=1631249 RepID=A0A1R3VH40_9HYPH|nr:hypothetical protein BQ8794_50273 [Mesorhizobium prunaredense]